jgi:hypothetical protein
VDEPQFVDLTITLVARIEAGTDETKCYQSNANGDYLVHLPPSIRFASIVPSADRFVCLRLIGGLEVRDEAIDVFGMNT